MARPELVEALLSLGVLIFGLTGVATILAGGNYLQYDVLNLHIAPGFLPHAEHLGMFLIELGVGITVASVMISIFYSFAGRE